MYLIGLILILLHYLENIAYWKVGLCISKEVGLCRLDIANMNIIRPMNKFIGRESLEKSASIGIFRCVKL